MESRELRSNEEDVKSIHSPIRNDSNVHSSSYNYKFKLTFKNRDGFDFVTFNNNYGPGPFVVLILSPTTLPSASTQYNLYKVFNCVLSSTTYRAE
ncbi:14963_t:CDS:2 [Funneliformis mosseae]|uniref:14963_t:CDS:1 n=1 Tax=Funneliformis mosseae TaxID=27381 RepID=A0A9N9AUH3_FUNMO|nr:14963_t:CDS:2 [Funneliformis mosseae]